MLTPGRPVTLSWDSPDGARFEIRISVDDGYLFNDPPAGRERGPGARRAAPGRPCQPRRQIARSVDGWTMHVGPMGFLDGKANYDIDWETLDDAGANGVQINSNGGWLGFTDKYWLTALAPNGRRRDRGELPPRLGNGGYQADFAMQPVIVSPGQALTTETRAVRRRQGKGAARPLRRRRASPSSPSRSTGAGSNGSCGRSSTC